MAEWIARFILLVCGLWLAWVLTTLFVLPATSSEPVALACGLALLAIYWWVAEVLLVLPRAIRALCRQRD